MKKIFTILLLAVLLSAAAPVRAFYENFEEVPSDCGLENGIYNGRTPKFSNFIFSHDSESPLFLRSPKNINGAWDTIPYISYYIGQGGFTHYMNHVSYEPQTNSVLIFYPVWVLTKESDGTRSGTYGVYADIYKNGGSEFYKTLTIAEGKDSVFAYTNGAVVNTIEGNTDPEKLNIVVNGELSTRAAAWKYTGEGIVAYDPSSAGSPIRTSLYSFGPNGTTTYRYRNMNSVGVKGKDYTTYIMGNPLFVADGSSAKHGRYGFLGVENESDHNIYLDQFAEEFGVDKFKAPTSTGIYNDYVKFDKDPEGTVYAMVNNIFISNENRRIPAVAKSTDLGNSWSKFDSIPWSVVDNFVLSITNGQYNADEANFGFRVYESGSFVVTGVDEFSYIVPCWCVDRATYYYYYNGLVEIYKYNGVWGMRPLEDMRYWGKASDGSDMAYGAIPDILTYSSSGINGNEGMISENGRRAFEEEISRTADNRYLLAKWIEYKYTYDSSKLEGTKYLKNYDSYMSSLGTDSVKVYISSNDNWNEAFLTAYSPVNIYCKYRKITDTEWSEPINLTEDDNYYLNTHTPRVIPNFTETEKRVPILVTLAKPYSLDDSTLTANNMTEYLSIKKNVAEPCRGMIADYNRHVLYSEFDLAKNQSGVREYENSGIGIYPNPASSNFTVKVETEGMNQVEIYTILGEKVMEFSGMQKHFQVDAAALPTGVYLVKNTNNGQTFTSLFTVKK